jgi:PilZ domain
MPEKRKDRRVVFGRGIPTHLMAIDGTWRRASLLLDVSDSGAKLKVEGSIEGLKLKEFFLLLSSTGLAYRRCELIWINGEQIGVNFIKPGDKKRRPPRPHASMAPAAPPAS